MSTLCPCCGQRIVTADEHRRATNWIGGGDTGMSSKTIWRVMTGYASNAADTPSDRGDFGRCHRLLKLMPEWRERLAEVSSAHAMWAPFVEAWPRLELLYEGEGRDDRAFTRLLDEVNETRLADYYRRTGRTR